MYLPEEEVEYTWYVFTYIKLAPVRLLLSPSTSERSPVLKSWTALLTRSTHEEEEEEEPFVPAAAKMAGAQPIGGIPNRVVTFLAP
jgi:hypothetical protein